MNWFKSLWRAMHASSSRRRTAGEVGTSSRARGADASARFESFVVDQSLRNFSPRAQQVLALARKEADRLHHHFVGTEHVLLGIVSLAQGTAVTVLGRMGVNLETVRVEVEKSVGTGPDEKIVGNIPYTPRVKKALSLAAKQAVALNHTYVGTEHILLGLLLEGDGVAARVLVNLGVNAETARESILKELNPDYSPGAAPVVPPALVQTKEPRPGPIDLSKRYDVFCREGDEEVVYWNARFRRVRTLLKQSDDDFLSEYIELELENGQVVFVARFSIVRFTEHHAATTAEQQPPA